jgi:hypothetical protein
MQTRLEQLLKKGTSDYRGLETHLQATLRPVTPRPEFVGDLHRKLSHRAQHPELYAELEHGQVLLMIAISLLSIVLLLVLSARAIAMLVSALGFIQQTRRHERSAGRTVQAPIGLTRGQA